MKINCAYCGSLMDEFDNRCENCGDVNSAFRVQDDKLHTIEQLKQWYDSNGLPPEKITRFFIGKDCKEARAFGIYRDDSINGFVVYKNNSKGERTVRYSGGDEDYAVGELYAKLSEAVAIQKARKNI